MQDDRTCPPTPGTDGTIVNEKALTELRESLGCEVVTDLIKMFIADAPIVLCLIETADSAHQLERAAQHLHGGSLSLYLTRVSELCGRIKKAASKCQDSAMNADIEALRDAVSRTVVLLKKLESL